MNLRSPGNRNSQADLQRLQTDGKNKSGFPPLAGPQPLTVQCSENRAAEVELARKQKKKRTICFCLTQQSLSAECQSPLIPSDS